MPTALEEGMMNALENRFAEAQEAIRKSTGFRPETWFEALAEIEAMGLRLERTKKERDETRRAFCAVVSDTERVRTRDKDHPTAFEVAEMSWGRSVALQLFPPKKKGGA
jgi:hypothetical protein